MCTAYCITLCMDFEAGIGHCRIVVTSRYLSYDNTTAQQLDKYKTKLRHDEKLIYVKKSFILILSGISKQLI